METDELVSYFIDSSDTDFKAMQHLFKMQDYHWSLFVGHMVLEKLLKAFYIKNIDKKHPYLHNLLRLAEKANLELNEEQKDILVTVTTFNIKARYNDYKKAFYKTCTKNFTEEWINKIKYFRKWIKNQHLK